MAAVPVLAASLAAVPCPSVASPLQSAQALKAEAILGGVPSALERIRMSQAAPASYANGSSELASQQAVSSDLAAARCLLTSNTISQNASAYAALPAHISNLSISNQGADSEFLASSRIKIGKTPFDQAWDRVSARHLSLGQVESYMGTPASEPIAKIRQVNRWVNHSITYRDDSVLWHKADYWADAGLTLRKHAGDCEDIAIVKYQALLSLGFDPSDVYLTIARDLVRNADHALVIVRSEGRFYVLDDSTDDLLDGSQPNDYRPMLSFGAGKWLHGLQTVAQAPIYLSRNALSNARSIGINR